MGAAARELLWRRYLSRLRRGGVLADEILESAAAVARAAGPPTQAGPGVDAEYLQLVYDTGEHHLEIDVRAGRVCDWFYRDRRLGGYAGGEDLPIELDAAGEPAANDLEL